MGSLMKGGGGGGEGEKGACILPFLTQRKKFPGCAAGEPF